MKLFGQITELSKVVWRSLSGGNAIQAQPGASTGSVGAVTLELPPKTSGTSILVDTDSTQTLSGKSISSSTNSIDGLTGPLVSTTGTQTLTGKTMAAGSNTFSGFQHGTQVDNPSSGVHGVTGSVVGTTDTQTLSGKTYTNPIMSGAMQSAEIATPTTPPTNSWKEYFKTDGKYILDDAGIETKLESAVVPDLEDLGDVTITAPADNDRLMYDSGDGQWKNRALNYQISSSSGLFSSSATVFTDITNLTITITTSGNPVEFFLIPDGVSGNGGLISAQKTNSATAGAIFRLVRDATNLFDQSLSLVIETGSATADPEITIPTGAIKFLDTPAAGTYTYKMQLDTALSGQTISVFNCKLVAKEW